MDPERRLETAHLRDDIEATRASISTTASELRQKVGNAMHWQTYVERHPGVVFGGAAAVGVVIGRRLARRFSRDGSAGEEFGWSEGAGSVPTTATAVPQRLLEAGGSSAARLADRVEGLVNRIIDEVAEATERALVPAIVGGVQALLEGRRVRATRTRSADPVPEPGR